MTGKHLICYYLQLNSDFLIVLMSSAIFFKILFIFYYMYEFQDS